MDVSRTILFAEDSPDDVALIRIGFARAKLPLEVYFVDDGVIAIEYLEGRNKFADRAKYPLPCVLLTDLKMPRMDGFELLEWVRKHEQFRKLPVVVVTGSNQTQDRQRAMLLGADAYLTKGLLIHPPQSLIDAIVRYADGVPPIFPDARRSKVRIAARRAMD